MTFRDLWCWLVYFIVVRKIARVLLIRKSTHSWRAKGFLFYSEVDYPLSLVLLFPAAVFTNSHHFT